MEKTKYIDFLLSQYEMLGLSGKVPAEALDALVSRMVVEKYHKRDLLIRKGDVCDKWLFVAEGLVRVFYYKDDVDVTDLLATEGWSLPVFDSYYMGTPTFVNFEALEDSTILTLHKSDLEEVAHQYPQVALITRTILKRFLTYQQHRVDSLLFETAEEKYDRLLSNVPKILLRAPSIHVASYLGITPETLSRVRSKKTKK